MVNVRRCELSDAGAAMQLVGKDVALFEERFGAPFRLSAHLELSSLCVCVEDDDEKLIGFASFSDHPPVAVSKVPAPEWEDWSTERFPRLKKLHPENSTWLSLLGTADEQAGECTKQLLKAMFSTISQIDSCLLCLPTGTELWSPLDEMFVKLDPVYDVPFSVFLCDREALVPSLKIRLAQVEDHDDLIPVLNNQTELHTDIHGEFFLAEVIEGQDSTRKCIVAEADGRAVGLIALTTEIDVELLNQCHDLSPWGYLCDEIQEDIPEDELQEMRAMRQMNEAQLDPASRKVSVATEGCEVEPEEEAAVEERRASLEQEAELQEEQEEEEEAPFQYEAVAEVTTRAVHVPNCFAITMFCLDKKYECRVIDFLVPLFQVFGSELKYCLLTLPHTESESALMPFMTHVKPKSQSTFPHSLYLLHIDSLGAPPRVIPSTVGDFERISELLGGLEGNSQQSVSSLVMDDLNGLNAGVKTFSVMSQNRLVGVLGLDHSVTADEIKHEYQLEEMCALSEHSKPGQVAKLRYLVLQSVFENRAQFVLTDAMRHSSISLVACLTTKDSTPPPALCYFVQPLPRRLIQRSAELERNFHGAQTLHVFLKRFACEPKTAVNARVVVVGASDTGLGFIESLLSVPYLHFSNLVLLTKDGLPEHQPQPFASNAHTFAPGEIDKFGIGLKAHVLQQTMIGLDRQAKVVNLASGSQLPYDLLVLAVGVQDQTCRHITEEYPNMQDQVFSAHSDKSTAELEAVLAEAPQTRNALVYGTGLDVYCAAQGLIARGIPANQVQIVMATDIQNPDGVRFMQQQRVDDQVKKKLTELGIRMRVGKLESVQPDENGHLAGIEISDHHGELSSLACDLLLTCSAPDIDMDAFNAVNDQSLIYDGALVVDGRFRTNDSTIFAAGPVVKHQRRLRAKIPTRCFNSREVGNRLAACVLPVLDPASAFELDHPLALEPYTRAKCMGGVLPGGQEVFVVMRPEALHNHKPQPHQRELVTTGAGELCRITVDRYDHVTGLFHFGSTQVEHQNWLALFGLPETVINRLASRYDEGIVHNLVEFLREEWAMALYHDRFPDLMSVMAERLESDASVNLVQGRAKDELETGDFRVNLAMRRLVEASGHMELWGRAEWLLKQYMTENSNHLPMYNVSYASAE